MALFQQQKLMPSGCSGLQLSDVPL